MNQFSRVIVIGDGWGAIAVLKGLQKFYLPVYAISTDEDVLRIAPNIAENDIELYKNELLLFAGYKPIVHKNVLDANCCINIHYSLLPKFRGLHSTVWAILNDEDNLGATIHLMNEYMDDGDILYQYKVKNDGISTSSHYMEMFNDKISKVIADVLEKFIDGSLIPQKQDKSQASWVGRRTEKDCQIDFSRPINYQKAFFRALVKPYPLPFFIHNGEKYNVTKVGYHISRVETHIGRILNIDNEGLWVKVLDGYMIIKEIVNSCGDIISFSKFRIGQYLNKL